MKGRGHAIDAIIKSLIGLKAFNDQYVAYDLIQDISVRIMYLTEALCEDPHPSEEIVDLLEQSLNDSYQLYDQLLTYCFDKGWMVEDQAQQLKQDLRWAEKVQHMID